MIHPSFLFFLSAITCIAVQSYWLVKKKEAMKGWPGSVRLIFFFSFGVALAMAVWYIVLLIVDAAT